MKNAKTCTTILLLTLSLLLSACGGNDASATSMRLRKTEGKVQVDNDQGKILFPREDLGLYSGYAVGTKAESFAWVDLDNVKLAKLDEASDIKIVKDGGNLTIELLDGNLFFHVTEPLGDDETMTIRTATLAIGIRGTCGWVEQPVGKDATRVYLLEGKVECSTDDGKAATVAAGEMAEVSKGGEVAVQKFDVSSIPSFVSNEAGGDDAIKQMIEEIPPQVEPGSQEEEDPSAAEQTSQGIDWQDEALAQAMAEETGITDRPITLDDVLDIEGLDLTQRGIRNISALGLLTNLTQLYLGDNEISDVSPLSGLNTLVELNLWGNNISDVSALAGLNNLTMLNLWKNNISDISPLRGLTNLTELYLGENKISDISPLSGLKSLQLLGLSGNKIGSVNALSGLTGLSQLYLRNTGITDVRPLAGLKNLTQLELTDNEIADYSPVEFVPDLVKE